jgi:hypothetical protein
MSRSCPLLIHFLQGQHITTNMILQLVLLLGNVWVFSLGAAGSNAPVMHAVFPIEIALVVANKKHNIPLLDLDGPTLTVHSTVLSSFQMVLTNHCIILKLLQLIVLAMMLHRLIRSILVCDELLISGLYSHHCLFYTRFSSRSFRGNTRRLSKSINDRRH